MAKMFNRKREHSQVEFEPPVHLYPKRSPRLLEGFTYPVTPENDEIIKIFNWKDFPDLPKDFERKGSEKDVSQLANVFSKMEYKVENFQDLTREETIQELNKISKMELLDTTDKLILVVMSHGDEKDGDSFLTSEGKSISMDEIRNMFSNSNCPKLKGKPKIFICCFCRDVSEVNEGYSVCLAKSTSNNAHSPPSIASSNESELRKSEDEIDDAIEILNTTVDFLPTISNDSKETHAVSECIDYVNHSKQTQLPSLLEEGEKQITKAMVLSTEGLGPPSPPVTVSAVDDLEDMATLYSCEKGFLSSRLKREGAVMIQCLCSVIEEHGQDHDIRKIFCYLQEEMKKKKKINDFPNAEPFNPELKKNKLKTFKFC